MHNGAARGDGVIRGLFAYLRQWQHNRAMRRYARRRLADLQRRLAAHDQDMQTMARYPEPIQERMAAYRERLMQQIEAVSKHV